MNTENLYSILNNKKIWNSNRYKEKGHVVHMSDKNPITTLFAQDTKISLYAPENLG